MHLFYVRIMFDVDISSQANLFIFMFQAYFQNAHQTIRVVLILKKLKKVWNIYLQLTMSYISLFSSSDKFHCNFYCVLIRKNSQRVEDTCKLLSFVFCKMFRFHCSSMKYFFSLIFNTFQLINALTRIFLNCIVKNQIFRY